MRSAAFGVPLAALATAPRSGSAAVVDFEADAGAVAERADSATCWANGAALNRTLSALQPGDTLLIPNRTYHLMGGITASGLRSVTIRIDGTLSFSDDIHAWPRDASGRVLECIKLDSIENVTFTSAGKGTLQGNGGRWWGIPVIGYLVREENRPRLINVDNSKGLLFENLLMKDSPYWTFWVQHVDGLEVRHCDIDARRLPDDGHNLIDITAYNTDGFDVSGRNVWIHDCTVWNQDDCIAVKDGSENMLFERITASGVGLTIGSISGSIVRNITFRDCRMHNTFKGIYMKFRAGDRPGLIADVLYENIVIDNAEQWAIWIGPAQQSDDASNLCAAHPCSSCWPILPGATCGAPAAGTYENITLRNVTVNNPRQSPGVIIGNSTNPMRGIVFDGVRVVNPPQRPWGDDYYKCDGARGVATGGTWPVPPCFTEQ